MIVCQLCNKKPATVHLTDIQNNVKKELHMCEDCAQQKGFSFKHSIALPDLLVSSGKSQKKERKKNEKEITCDHCGTTWGEFRHRGRFGCAYDYKAFRERLMPLIADIHARQMKHVGKSPKRSEASGSLQREVVECRRRLREAVQREAYEEAADLRDRLQDLEREVGAQN